MTTYSPQDSEKIDLLIDQVGRLTEGIVELRFILVDGFAELRHSIEALTRLTQEQGRNSEQRHREAMARLDREAEEARQRHREMMEESEQRHREAMERYDREAEEARQRHRESIADSEQRHRKSMADSEQRHREAMARFDRITERQDREIDRLISLAETILQKD